MGAKGRRYVLVMVGLPARGKTYTARRLAGYLSWLGYPTRVFNVGEQRRQEVGAHQTHEFFDPDNKSAERLRRALAESVLGDLLDWLRGDARVAIFDATNSTRVRRDAIRRRCEHEGVEVVFVEIVNDDASVVEANVRENKLKSPDYAGVEPDEAVRDFRARIAHYEARYQTLEPDEGSFLRIADRGRNVQIHHVDGYLPARIVSFLTNLQITTLPIWLSRHGESEHNVRGLIGGNSPLSSGGRRYARNLRRLVDEQFPPEADLQVWTSTLRRAVETAETLGRESTEWRVLDEIDAGVCDGMSYGEIAERMPREYEARQEDKLRYRYPRGESYEDVIQRLDRAIVELERQRSPVLVVGHQAVLRALYAYLLALPVEECPRIAVPLHHVIQVTPRAYGSDVEHVDLGPPASPAGSSHAS